LVKQNSRSNSVPIPQNSLSSIPSNEKKHPQTIKRRDHTVYTMYVKAKKKIPNCPVEEGKQQTENVYRKRDEAPLAFHALHPKE